MSRSQIPSFYRFCFTWFDPIVASWGAYMDFVEPSTVLNAFVPSSIMPYSPQSAILFQQAGGANLQIAFIQAVFLRAYPQDLKLWRLAQTAVLIVDFAGLYSFWDGLGRQGRLAPAAWRGEDWGCVGITVYATVLRLAFLAGVGIGREVDAKSKKS